MWTAGQREGEDKVGRVRSEEESWMLTIPCMRVFERHSLPPLLLSKL